MDQIQTKEELAVKTAQANLEAARISYEATCQALAAAEANVEAAQDDASEAAAEAELKAAKKAENDAGKAFTNFTKALEKAKKAAEKAATRAEKAAERAAAKAAKEVAKVKMPEQNGVRRPKPETLCGKAWAIFDEVSNKNGAPASIKESLEIARSQGLNEGNVKAEYARWRKFFGISGRIETPKPASAEEATTEA